MAKDLLGDLPEPDIESGETAQPHVPPIDVTPASTASTSLVPPPMANTVPPADETPSLSQSQVTVKSSRVISLVADALDNPNIDGDKLRATYEIYQSELADVRKQAFITAKAKALKGVNKLLLRDRSIEITKSGTTITIPYTSRDLLEKEVWPRMERNGFDKEFDVEPIQGSTLVRIVCILSHSEGHVERRGVILPPDMNSPFGAVSGAMGTMTRGERKALMMALGLSSENIEDSDGDTPRITVDEASHISDLMAELETDEDRLAFLSYARVTRPSMIPHDRFESSVNALKLTIDNQRPSK